VTERVRVGSRRSRLARAQTQLVLARLARAAPEWLFEPMWIDTSGDRDSSVGTSLDFTDSIDRALIRGEVDLAVHSAKDLPVELDPRIDFVACPARADPRDCLVAARPHRSRSLPFGAKVGSSSLRRKAQLLRWRPDLNVIEIRGNVDTRIGHVRSGAIDAAVLAVAGISRLNRMAEVDRILPSTSFLPAPAQGALAVMARTKDSQLSATVARIDHAGTRACVRAERTFSATLGGDCHLPLAALAKNQGRSIVLTGQILTPDGRLSLRMARRGPSSQPERIGSELGQAMLAGGAPALLRSLAR
jgi:hydroxymethylbilane synthase